MIVEWNLGWMFSALRGLIDAWGGWTVPASFGDFGPALKSFLLMFDGLGVWAPWDLMGACVAAVISTYVICFTVKVALRVASYLPFVGGAG